MNLVFYFAVAALFTHEMDAVMQAEWRLFYFLRDMPDAAAYPVFVLLHFPLFVLFFWLSSHPYRPAREGFRFIVSIFLIVHAGLHWHLSGRQNYGFEGVFSNIWIALAALGGVAYVALHLLERRRAGAGRGH